MLSDADQFWLVLFETAGNQNYIFSTNKLRENVGASHLIWRSCVPFVFEALSAQELLLTGVNPQDLFDSQFTRQFLLDVSKNPSIESGKAKSEVVLATSGKALILFRNEQDARSVISIVTQRTLEQAPGLDLRAAYVKVDGAIWQAISKLHQETQRLPSVVPGPNTRFGKLPIAAPCATSSLPAERINPRQPQSSNSSQLISRVAFQKQQHAVDGTTRINQIPANFDCDFRFPKTIDEIDSLETTDWLAVVHADGNGLGQVFLNFEKYCGAISDQDCRKYIDQLRKFSAALDYCTESSYVSALKKFKERVDQFNDGEEQPLPIVPLILGGDDLTVVCDGRMAIQFAVDYLGEFQALTGKKKLVEQISNGVKIDYRSVVKSLLKKTGTDIFETPPICVYASAGVACIKPHFPFHNAYSLASDLIASAKNGVRDPQTNLRLPCSSIDFHIVLDSSYSSLDKIRKHLTVDNGKTLNTAKPYFVGESPKKIEHRSTNDVVTMLETIHGVDQATGNRLIPGRVIHELRDALALGEVETISRINRIVRRYGQLASVLFENESPYFGGGPSNDSGSGSPIGQRTMLLDLFELDGFWQLTEELEK